MNLPASRDEPFHGAPAHQYRRRSLLGVEVDCVDYGEAVKRIILAAEAHRPFAVAALAVHGVMTGALDRERRAALNSMDMAVPDGQPVRWGLNVLHRAGLQDQVRGTTLTIRVLGEASRRGLSVYFYGSTQEVLERILSRLAVSFPSLRVAGMTPSQFRGVGLSEQSRITRQIRQSGADIVIVGLGCPRQETFAAALRNDLGVPMLAVGAAFDYIAGTLAAPPEKLRRAGLEWLWRLWLEPRRLWRRYLLLNPLYLLLVTAERLGLWRPAEVESNPPPRGHLDV